MIFDNSLKTMQYLVGIQNHASMYLGFLIYSHILTMDVVLLHSIMLSSIHI